MKTSNLHGKRALRTALFVLLLSVVGMTKTYAQTTFTVGNLNYSINSDGATVTVTGHVDGTAASGTLDIPTMVSYDGMTYQVTVVGDEAFNNCRNLTGDLVIPNSVISIGNRAFAWSYMNGLAGNLTIPNSVVTIGEYAFSTTYFIGSLVIPNSVKTIGANAFWQCSRFTGDLIIPNSLTKIEDAVFSSCNNLNGNLIIPNSIISIGKNAFAYSKFTGELVVSSKVYDIGEGAFSGCQFTSINVDSANRHYKSVNGVLFSYNEKTLLQYPGGMSGSSFNIPNYVTRIGFGAFYGCGNLTDISIPASVSSIGGYAFDDNGWYENQSAGVLYLDGWCLGWKGRQPNGEFVRLSGELVIHEGTIGIAESAFQSQLDITSLSLPNSMMVIGDGAFSRCSGLTGRLELPNSVTSIGNLSFYGCSGFTGSLVLPNSLKTIGNAAFSADMLSGDNMGFTGELIIPNAMVSIGDYAFYRCYGITSISISESVETIGSYSFTETGWYTALPDGIVYKDRWYLGYKGASTGTLNLEEGARGVAGRAFYNRYNFTGDLVIPNSLVYIGDYAFYNCRNLAGELVVPNSVKEIGEYAFYYCSGFDGRLSLGNSLSKIGCAAFYFCSGFKGELVLPNSMTTMESFAFFGCTGFTGDLVIPNSLTEIREGTFSNFNGGPMGFDGNLLIPNSVSEIYDQAFCCCNNLQSIKVNCETSPEIIKVWPDEEEDAFYGINKGIPVYVPCNTASEYQSANYWNQFNNFQETFLYNLTIEAIDPEHCTINIVQQPSCELQAIVKAEPAAGYVFVAWEEDGMVVSNEMLYTFNVDHDVHLFARVKSNIGVSEGIEESFAVYPNPSQGYVTVEGTGTLTIANTLGQTIMTKEIEGKAKVELPQGLYFVTLGGETRKIVVE